MSRCISRHLYNSILYCLVGFILILNIGCSDNKQNDNNSPTAFPQLQSDNNTFSPHSIQPLPLQPFQLDAKIVTLGEQLFNDVRLSGNNTISCANCHNIALGGVDRQAFSIGVAGRLGDINSPTVFNAAFNFKQFWDGRANSLEEQINGPVNNPKEMNSNWPEVINKLKQDKALKKQFTQHYADGITAANIRDAIATYERSLTTPNARLDQYLRGNPTILTQDEIEGFELFNSLGCSSCHQGVNIGGNMFQSLGIMRNYFKDRGHISKSDFGRYNVTGQAQDKFKFKVPSLRNIALTAPYFHDGSAQTLQQAVNTMAYYQLGLRLSEREVELLIKFLNTLTGEPFNINTINGLDE